jgi:TPR repeat protein
LASAQCELGSAYLNGLGVLQDTQKAAEWFFKAAIQGDGLSAVKLGLLYKEAADTPTNRIEAHKWFSLAAAQGDEDAKGLRDGIALKMSAPELAEARKRAQAFSTGNIPAQLVEIQTVGVARPAARGQTRVSSAPTVNGTAAMKEGVPLSIYNAIATAAAKEWPGDYEMQAYVIKNQIEAFKKLHPQ